MCSVVESHRRSIGGRYSNQMALSAVFPFRQRTKKDTWVGCNTKSQGIQKHMLFYISHAYYCPSKINEECRSSSFHLFSPSTFLSIARTASYFIEISKQMLYCIKGHHGSACSDVPLKCHFTDSWHNTFCEFSPQHK